MPVEKTTDTSGAISNDGDGQTSSYGAVLLVMAAAGIAMNRRKGDKNSPEA